MSVGPLCAGTTVCGPRASRARGVAVRARPGPEALERARYAPVVVWRTREAPTRNRLAIRVSGRGPAGRLDID